MEKTYENLMELTRCNATARAYFLAQADDVRKYLSMHFDSIQTMQDLEHSVLMGKIYLHSTKNTNQFLI